MSAFLNPAKTTLHRPMERLDSLSRVLSEQGRRLGDATGLTGGAWRGSSAGGAEGSFATVHRLYADCPRLPNL